MISDNEYGLYEIQSSLLEQLKALDTFCRKNDIRYSLDSGTLLGAVRHHGFIPWDDDADICMDRENFKKFLHCYDTVKNPVGEGYRLDRLTVWVWRLYGEKSSVDIFPFDAVPDNPVLAKVKLFMILLLQGMLKDDTGKFKNFRFPYNIFSWITYFAGRPFPMEKKRKWFDKVSQLWPGKKQIECYSYSFGMVRIRYPADMLEHFTELPFEGQMFSVMRDRDQFLTAVYGDYMQPPPENERLPKHRKIVENCRNREDDRL